jgi:hypothetical protein
VSKDYGVDSVSYYWSKVFEIDRLMNLHPEIEIFCWIDSDAFVVNMDKTIESLIEDKPEYSMFISPDQPEWKAKFNSGVFIVRNNELGRAIMSEWKSKYDSTKWVKEGNKWNYIGYDPNDPRTAWAGIYYEQGAFEHYIMNNAKYAKHIYSFPYYVLQEFDCSKPHGESFTIHLAGAHLKKSFELTCKKAISKKQIGGSGKQSTVRDKCLMVMLLLILVVVIMIVIFIKH